MLQTQTREIGGKTYQVTQLSSEPGQRLFFHLAKLVGPSVSALLREWQGGAVDASTVAAALSELLSQLTYQHFRDFVDTFLKNTALIADGKKLEFSVDKNRNQAFVGDYGSLCKWLAFCLEVNYGSFFDDMGLTKLPGVAVEQSASASPQESAG